MFDSTCAPLLWFILGLSAFYLSRQTQVTATVDLIDSQMHCQTGRTYGRCAKISTAYHNNDIMVGYQTVNDAVALSLSSVTTPENSKFSAAEKEMISFHFTKLGHIAFSKI